MATQLDHRAWTASWGFRPLRPLPPARHPAPTPRQAVSLDLRSGGGWPSHRRQSSGPEHSQVPDRRPGGGGGRRRGADHCPGRLGRPGQVRVVAVVSWSRPGRAGAAVEQADAILVAVSARHGVGRCVAANVGVGVDERQVGLLRPESGPS